MKSKKMTGFTLVETLVAMGIFVLVGLAISTFTRDIFVYSSTTQGSLTAQQSAQNVLRQMIKELRTASDSSMGTAPLAEVLPTRIKFYSDIDGDVNTKEEVHYYLSNDGKTLYKDVWKPTNNPSPNGPLQYIGASTTKMIIAANLINGATPIFTYYDKNYTGAGAALSQPVDITAVRLVKINLIIDADPNRSPTPINVTTEVTLRNLKDNL